MTPRALVLLVVIDLYLLIGVARATPCPRSGALPRELPQVGCPTVVTRTNAANAQTVVLRLVYPAIAPESIASAWGDALTATKNWKVTVTKAQVVATLGHDKVTIDAAPDPGTKGAIVTLTFVPG